MSAHIDAIDYEVECLGQCFNIYDFANSITLKLTKGELKEPGLFGKLKDPRVIVDAGANVGAFSVAAAKLYPQARVVSIEPVPQTHSLMRTNIERNCGERLDKHVYVPAALATHERGVNLGVFEQNPGAASFQHAANSGNIVNVPTVRLEDMLDELGIDKVDFLKLDVEGMEYQILWDVKDWSRIGALSVELHGIVDWPQQINRAIYTELTAFLSFKTSTVIEIKWPHDVLPSHARAAFDPRTHSFLFRVD